MDTPLPESVEQVATAVVDAAYAVHKALGPGLLESAYEACLSYELRKRGLAVRSQVVMPIVYDGVTLAEGFRADMVVCDCVLVELKCVDAVLPVHEAQVLTYLRLSGLPIGFLINFHAPLLKLGIKRFRA
ncbi:MAG: GxxExxY protein [Armatimonadetes bacterium]|nr:GxxExxY protein [Armatimonadota bacterium]